MKVENPLFNIDDRKDLLRDIQELKLSRQNSDSESSFEIETLNNIEDEEIKRRIEVTNKLEEYGVKTFMAWSCCMNTYKDSKGCVRQKINRHHWNLDHF